MQDENYIFLRPRPKTFWQAVEHLDEEMREYIFEIRLNQAYYQGVIAGHKEIMEKLGLFDNKER